MSSIMRSGALRLQHRPAVRAQPARAAQRQRAARAQLIEPPSQQNVGNTGTLVSRRQNVSAGALAVTGEVPFAGVDATPSLEAQQQQAAVVERRDGSLLRRLTYGVNGGLLASAGLALLAANDANVLWLVPDSVQTYGESVGHLYACALAAHPVALKAAISGAVFSLGDLTAQAYEGRGVSHVDWMRTFRSGAIGATAQGPLSHWAFSSDGCLIDGIVDQMQGLEEWQRPLAKIAVDQTAFSLAWNSLYFGLLGAMRLESPGAIFRDLRSSGFSLMKAGWRLWPLAHLLTYTLVPPEHRLLFVDMVELAWVTVLVVWGQQTAANAAEAADAAADSSSAVTVEDLQPPAYVAMERSASQEMRAGLLMDSMHGSGAGAEQDSAAWQTEQSA